MKTIIVTIITAIASIFGGHQNARDSIQREFSSLNGTWVLLTSQVEGERWFGLETSGVKWDIKDGLLLEHATSAPDSIPFPFSMKIDPKTSPKRMEATLINLRNKSTTYKYIYYTSDDYLLIARNPNEDKFPPSFIPSADVNVLIFRREKACRGL